MAVAALQVGTCVLTKYTHAALQAVMLMIKDSQQYTVAHFSPSPASAVALQAQQSPRLFHI